MIENTMRGPSECPKCRASGDKLVVATKETKARPQFISNGRGSAEFIGYDCRDCGEQLRFKEPSKGARVMTGWIGVDLDGTLAHYGGWISPDHIGEPITPMVERIKEWLGKGIEVRIFTARAWRADDAQIAAIQDWSEKHIGHRLAVTCTKDYGMIELWDDRAVRVRANCGQPCCADHVR